MRLNQATNAQDTAPKVAYQTLYNYYLWLIIRLSTVQTINNIALDVKRLYLLYFYLWIKNQYKLNIVTKSVGNGIFRGINMNHK